MNASRITELLDWTRANLEMGNNILLVQGKLQDKAAPLAVLLMDGITALPNLNTLPAIAEATPEEAPEAAPAPGVPARVLRFVQECWETGEIAIVYPITDTPSELGTKIF